MKRSGCVTRARSITVVRVVMTVACMALTHRLDAQAASVGTADSVSRRRILLLPAVASAPETGIQLGATVLAVWQPAARDTRPASLTAAALRTAKSQTRYRIDGERWSRGNARRVAGSVQLYEFPLPYFGIGDRSPKSAEETFTPTGGEVTLAVQQRIRDAWYATGGVRFVSQRIRTDSRSALAGSQLPGRTGGTMTEWAAGLMHDTRDNVFAPQHGDWIQLSYARSVSGVASDFSYGALRLDARAYRPIRGAHIVATQLQIVSVDGSAPFDQLALVGNSDILRGYARGRYRDRATAAIQSEYRSPEWHRLGWVAFAGAGVARPSVGSFSGARALPSYGAGLRVQIDQRQRTGVRADYGRGRDGASGLYIGFNQAF